MAGGTTTRRRSTRPAATTAGITFPSELGWMALAWQGKRLRRVTFGHSDPSQAFRAIPMEFDVSDRPPGVIAELMERLCDFAKGRPGPFDDVVLDEDGLTEFQRRVTLQCRRIPLGETRTYGDLAKLSGSPGAARAVGSVMARNRFPLVVPCHRVVAAGGAIGGFSAPDGLSMKRRLLAIEEAGC